MTERAINFISIRQIADNVPAYPDVHPEVSIVAHTEPNILNTALTKAVEMAVGINETEAEEADAQYTYLAEMESAFDADLQRHKMILLGHIQSTIHEIYEAGHGVPSELLENFLILQDPESDFNDIIPSESNRREVEKILQEYVEKSQPHEQSLHLDVTAALAKRNSLVLALEDKALAKRIELLRRRLFAPTRMMAIIACAASISAPFAIFVDALDHSSYSNRSHVARVDKDISLGLGGLMGFIVGGLCGIEVGEGLADKAARNRAQKIVKRSSAKASALK